jgi:hypothetical protein
LYCLFHKTHELVILVELLNCKMSVKLLKIRKLPGICESGYFCKGWK